MAESNSTTPPFNFATSSDGAVVGVRCGVVLMVVTSQFLHVLNWRDVASDGFVVLAAKRNPIWQVPRTGFLSAGQWKQGRETKLPPESPSSDPRSSAFIRGRFRSSTGAPGAGTGRIRPSGIGSAARSPRQAVLAVEQLLGIVLGRVNQQALACFQPGGRLETVAGGLDNELFGVVRGQMAQDQARGRRLRSRADVPLQERFGPANDVAIQGDRHVGPPFVRLDVTGRMLHAEHRTAGCVLEDVVFDHGSQERSVRPSPDHGRLGGAGEEPYRVGASQKV